MIYVNSTGKNIGNCFTGFGVSYPVEIFNSGNSNVIYGLSFDNQNSFLTDSSSFTLSPGSSKTVKLEYNPSLQTISDIQESGILTISSASTEDSSVDPSGNISVFITGNRFTDITGGYPRAFYAYKDRSDGIPKLQFYWLPPTGTNNLNNYFITGYTLDIASNSNFSTLVNSYSIPVGQNQNNSPKYATFNGFQETFLNYTVKDNLIADTTYYSRLYTTTNSHTGISIYASGVETSSPVLSQEVLNGYSGTPIDLKINKTGLNVYIDLGIYLDFDLFSSIKKFGGTNFALYSGVNVYFSQGSTFKASKASTYAVNLIGSLNNLTGDSNGTNINFYIPKNVNFYSVGGNGGVMEWGASKEKNQASNGGDIFNLSLTSLVNTLSLTDLNYYFIKDFQSNINAGGGGSRGGLLQFGLGGNVSTITINSMRDLENPPGVTTANYAVNGNDALDIISFNGMRTWLGDSYSSQDNSSGPQALYNVTFTTPSAGYGESGSNNLLCFFNSTSTPNVINSVLVSQGDFGVILNAKSAATPYISFNTTPTPTKTSPGKVIKTNANTKCFLTTNNVPLPTNIKKLSNSLPVDNIQFRALDLAAGTTWNSFSPATTNSFILTDTPTFNSNYYSTALKCLPFADTKFSTKSFTTSNNDTFNTANFDIFLLVSLEFPAITDASIFNTKILDWYTTGTENTTAVNLTFKKLTSPNYSYQSENFGFSAFFNPLRNKKFVATYLNSPTNQVSFGKSITNSTSYYPLLININRSGTSYRVLINNVLVSTYFCDVSELITTSSVTTLQIGNINSSNDKVTKVNYFDILMYNRYLSDAERLDVCSYYLYNYYNLFAGQSSPLRIDSTNFRVPNFFGLAGNKNI